MAEIQIQNEIDKLKNLSNNKIDNEEIVEAKSILEVIKSGKPSKEQLDEIIKLLQFETMQNSDYVIINQLSSYQKDFETLLNNYNTEKQVIVDETVANKSEVVKNQNKVNENSDSQKKYNENHIDTYSQRINTVLGKLDENDKTQKEIKEALGNTLISSSDIRVRNLQDLLISSGAKINSDGWFGRKTMKALEKIVRIKNVDTTTVTHNKGITLNAASMNNKGATTVKPNIKTPDNFDLSQNTISSYTISKNGRVLLNGKNLDSASYNLDPKILENLRKSQKDLALLAEIHEIWSDAAVKYSESMTFGILRGDKKRSIDVQVMQNEKILSQIISDFATNGTKKGTLNKELVNKYFSEISINGATSGIVTNFNQVKTIFNSKEKIEDKKIKIFEAMRSGWVDNGNSAKIATKLEADVASKFTFTNKILNNPALLENIDNAEGLYALGVPQFIANDISKNYGKVKVNQEKRRSEIQKALLNKNGKNPSTSEVDKYITIATQTTCLESLRGQLVDFLIESNTRDGKKMKLTPDTKKVVDEYIKVKGDENIDNYEEIGFTVALAAVSMGAGALAARGAMGLLNMAAKTDRGIASINYLNSGTRTARGLNSLGTIGSIALEGTAFYEGSNFAHNVMYKDNISNLFDESANPKEIAKSIAFFGVLRGASKFAEKFKLSEKVPPLMLKNVSITGTLAEAGLLVGTSQGIEFAFGEDFNPTGEEYIQALMMVALLRGTGSIRKVEFSKGKDGEIKMETEANGANIRSQKIPEGVDFIVNSKGETKGKNSKINEPENLHDYKWTAEKPGQKTEANKENTSGTINYSKIDNEILSNLKKLKVGESFEIGGTKVNKVKTGKNEYFEIEGNQAQFSKVDDVLKLIKAEDKNTYLFGQTDKLLHSLKEDSILNIQKGDHTYEISKKGIIKIDKDGTRTILKEDERVDFVKNNTTEIKDGLEKKHGIFRKNLTESEARAELEAKYGKEKCEKMTTKLKIALEGVKKLLPPAIAKDLDAGFAQFTKDILWNKYNRVGALSGGLLDRFLLDNYVDGPDRVKMFFFSVFAGYMGGAVINIGAGKVLRYTGSALWSTTKGAWRHKGKIILGGSAAYIAWDRTNYDSFAEMFTEWTNKEKIEASTSDEHTQETSAEEV